MTDDGLLYIRSLSGLREKLAKAGRDGTAMGKVWGSLLRRARSAPDAYPWFTPFVAVATGGEGDIQAAKRQILNYVATLDAQQFGMGLQFHFWCFAFPHARWTLYFHWLDQLGAWTERERASVWEALTVFQFTNFFYGMRTKPEPECVDNQTLSLCFSNALFGHLFGSSSALSRRMGADGFRRLPGMLGGFPPSGYSGEGSTYMDYVVGPAIPFVVELLERENGGDWFNQALPPHGGSAAAVVRMVAREWMPNGLLLPWDHYGYSLPVTSGVAYGARRIGDPLYFDLLENAATWGNNIGVGWGFDDLVWTLVWWPERKPESTRRAQAWVEPEVGGALVSDDRELYLMQMWDRSTPKTPIREHVNPNALVLSAYGSPLTVDGVPAKECAVFNFDDTWLNRDGMDFNAVQTNFGPGCAGAHGVVLVDGWEGMRVEKEFKQAELREFDPEGNVLAADVTPIYRERWPDTLAVRRRSRLCAERFWLVEDLAAFAEEHELRSRWMLRPELVSAGQGLEIETAEGVRLWLLPLLGPGMPETTELKGFPDRLDCRSLRADFIQRGRECRWLFLAFPHEGREVVEDITDGWAVARDPEASFGFGEAVKALTGSPLRLSIEMPPFLLAELPVARRWWYAKELRRPQPGRWWIRLPRGLAEPAVWVNGVQMDLGDRVKLAELMPIDIEMSADTVVLVLRTDTGTRQYEEDGSQGINSFQGRAASLSESTGGGSLEASFKDGVASVRFGRETWTVAHELMKVEL